MVDHLYDFILNDREDPVWQIMMPLYHGSLWDILPLNDTSTIEQAMTQTAEALLFMHGNDTLHRDVKPENILIKRVSPIHIALADLGWASSLQDKLALRKACGTPGFATPEVPVKMNLISNVVQTAAIDVHSLGGTFYFILHPERRTDETQSAIAYHVGNRPPRLYAGLILSMMSRDPKEGLSLNQCLDVIKSRGYHWTQDTKIFIAPEQASSSNYNSPNLPKLRHDIQMPEQRPLRQEPRATVMETEQDSKPRPQLPTDTKMATAIIPFQIIKQKPTAPPIGPTKAAKPKFHHHGPPALPTQLRRYREPKTPFLLRQARGRVRQSGVDRGHPPPQYELYENRFGDLLVQQAGGRQARLPQTNQVTEPPFLLPGAIEYMSQRAKMRPVTKPHAEGIRTCMGSGPDLKACTEASETLASLITQVPSPQAAATKSYGRQHSSRTHHHHILKSTQEAPRTRTLISRQVATHAFRLLRRHAARAKMIHRVDAISQRTEQLRRGLTKMYRGITGTVGGAIDTVCGVVGLPIELCTLLFKDAPQANAALRHLAPEAADGIAFNSQRRLMYGMRSRSIRVLTVAEYERERMESYINDPSLKADGRR